MVDLSAWTPESVQALRNYDRKTFAADDDLCECGLDALARAKAVSKADLLASGTWV